MHYIPGKELVVADALSRAPLSTSNPERPTREMSYYVHSVFENVPINSNRLQQIKAATADDSTMQSLLKYIKDGWPSQKNEVEQDICPYYNIRDDLTEVEGLILKGQRIVIPPWNKENKAASTSKSILALYRT